ncbi:FUSC family protein [Bordetella sp. 15P40C-2]|uniref:FUSC family protein n=1 Tax=Bordetella sp. 15P40C-2 TaxID=2572246 RepID=UPI001323DC3D|nr:FUSC family protein [Bordetella sp. 15P40C-2]MVW72376.1 FUSC family protein [Bordetella sp. 15P40C-2]
MQDKPPISTPSAPSRRDAARQLLHASRIAESVRLGKQASLRNSALAGLQAAIAAGIALAAFQLSPWSHLMGFASLGALVALFGRFAPTRSRIAIVLQCACWQTVAVAAMSATAWAGWSHSAQLMLLAVSCGAYLFICFKGKFGAPGPLIFIFAVGASMTDTLTLEQVAQRTAATAIAVAFAWLVCILSERLRHTPNDRPGLPVEPDVPMSHLWRMTLRMALAALAVVFIADHLGLQFPAWAAMGTVAVMQGRHLHISMHRALQRMVGTVFGALIAWLLLEQDPSIWILIAALMMFQFCTEVVIGFNYGLAQALVTPMALLMTHLAAPNAAITTLAPERVVDTMLGAIIGMVVALALSSIEDRQTLALHHQSVMPPDRPRR